ncbi:glutaredoxin-C3 [Biomphalaria pfeifferi]|uniref:Glutaredoxin-C3 n=1 Tax=Biomphalaria pfeifferi TaxID=112525 RepID=A0AAD8F620_BIOPF|nr:glutaredoxin-C3 [Biomphalaria pfeifferi]
MAGSIPFVDTFLKHKKIVLFGKSYSPETNIIKDLLKQNYFYELSDRWFCSVDIEKRQDCSTVENYLMLLTGYNNRQVPLLFVRGRIIGSYDQILRLHKDDRLKRLFTRFSLESDSDDDDDDVKVCRMRRHEMVVRVEELDETEVVVKVADWVQLDEKPIVDYDAFRKSDSTTTVSSELNEINRASFINRVEQKYKPSANKKAKSVTEVDPEWVYVGGKKHKDPSGHMGSSTTMIKSKHVFSVVEVPLKEQILEKSKNK